MKKGALILLFLLLMSPVYADIYATLRLGETRHFLTPAQNYSITLESTDIFSGRTKFIVNNNDYELLPIQGAQIGDSRMVFLGKEGNTLGTYAANLFILSDSYFACERICENSTFVSTMKLIDNEFELCKKDCTSGCWLYKERICDNREVWIRNNCGQKVELVESCPRACNSGYCLDCPNNICEEIENYFNCVDCRNIDYCVSDKDCKDYCVNGKCSILNFKVGDGICSLPQESCSSPDCSCENKVTQPKSRKDYPIILVHGFASSPEKLKSLQRELAFDLNYNYGGQISILDLTCTSTDEKTVYVATYYKHKDIKAKKEDKTQGFFYNSYLRIVDEQEDQSSNFVDTLSQVIDKVRACTDSEKVNIIGHSMGGIVARSYILKDDNIKNIDKLIFIGVPAHGGIYGEENYQLLKGLEAQLGDRRDLLKTCSSIGLPTLVLSFLDGRDVTGECEEIHQVGASKNAILRQDETPGLVEYYTVAGDIDGQGDGMIPYQSAALYGAVANYVVECDHFILKDPQKCRDSYVRVLESLGFDGALAKDSFWEKIKKFWFFIKTMNK